MKRPSTINIAFLGVLLFAQSLLAQDALVSNGTCYFMAGAKANSRYIPCGNVAFGHFTCCEGQDMCLSNNACYNGNYGVTYLAGCSDPTYDHESCPNKGDWSHQEWVGLSYCNGTSDEWVACDDSRAESNTVTAGEPCWCPTTSATIAFSAASVLPNIIRLPTSTGQSMCSPSFGVCPNSATTASSVSRTSVVQSSLASPSSNSDGRISSKTTLTASTSAPPPTSASQTSAPTATQSASGLSTDAKVGIGIGASIGGCISLAVLGCIPLCIRRRKQRQSIIVDATIRPRSQAITTEKDPSEELNQCSPAWSGNVSELAGGERNSASLVSPQSTQGTWSRPTSAEVEGSIPAYQSMGNTRAQALGGIGLAYKPYRKSNAPPVGVHEVSGESDIAQTARRSARRPGSGVFEIPASVPGSTLPY